MRHLIPRYIHDACRRGEREGSLEGASLFLDLSGFTAMSQALMRQGKSGAESISKLLLQTFAPLEDAVIERGGFITGFAGDALTAVFPGGDETAAQAVDAALVSRRAVEALKSDFPIRLKVGLSFGVARWWVFDANGHWTWVFRGPAISNCVVSESRASPGQIIADEAIRGRVPRARWDALGDGFSALHDAPSPPRPTLAPWAVAEVDPAIAQRFYPLALWDQERPGEFRALYALFLSFELAPGVESLKALVDHTLEACDLFDAHFNRIDFGDKGGVAILYFGAPVAHEDDATRALRLPLEWSKGLPPGVLRWRWGIAEGEAYTGIVGDRIRGEYGALGNVVNLSARLATHATWGEVLVSWEVPPEERAATLRCEPVGERRFKGFPNAVPVWRLIGERERTATQRGVDLSPMVGRVAEIEAIQEALGRIRRGEPGGTVVIHGDPGLGKSFLVATVRSTTPPGLSWLTARTEPVLRRALQPFSSLVRGAAGLEHSASEAENERRLDAWLDTLIAGAPPDAAQHVSELERTRGAISELARLRRPDALFDALEPKLRQENQMLAVIGALLVESWRQPLVLEIEDGHWLDEASSALLGRLTRLLARRPALIVISSRYRDDGARVEYPVAFGAPRLELELRPLEAHGLSALAASVLGAPADDALLTLLKEKSSSNPFFARQILLWLQEHGGVQLRDGVWALGESRFLVPSGVKPLLTSRLDRLDVSVRRAVQGASVLGQEFQLRVLTHMLRGEPVDVWAAQATRARIWREMKALHYLFEHALLRDAAYEMQLPDQLRTLHRDAAEAIESLSGDERPMFSADLAYHWGMAGDEARELPYAVAAARAAADHYDNVAALRWSARGLEIAEALPQRFELLRLREQVLSRIGETDSCEAILVELEAIAGRVGAWAEAEAMLARLSFQMPRGHCQDGLALAIRAEAFAKENGLWEYAERFAYMHAAMLGRLGHLHRSREAFEAIIARDQLSKRGELLCLYLDVIVQIGSPEVIKAALGQALTAAMDEDDLELQRSVWQKLATRSRLWGERDAARDALERARQLARQTGERRGELKAGISLGIACGAEGRYEESNTHIYRAMEICYELDDVRGEITSKNNLGVLHRYMGDFDTASDWLEQSEQQNEALGRPIPESISCVSRALIAVQRGRPDEALEMVGRERVRAIAGVSPARDAALMTIEGLAWEVKGDLGRARERWRRSVEAHTSLGNVSLQLDAGAGLLRAALAEGDLQEALAWAEQILAQGDGSALLDVDDPFLAYLSAWRALDATGDPRADGLLERAHDLMQRVAAGLRPERREGYLENIPSQRALGRTWRARQGA